MCERSKIYWWLTSDHVLSARACSEYCDAARICATSSVPKMTTWRCASWISGCDSVKYTNGLFDARTALSVQRNAWARSFAYRFPEAVRMTSARLVIDCSTTHPFCDVGNFSREGRSLEWSTYECTFPAHICTTQISMFYLV